MVHEHKRKLSIIIKTEEEITKSYMIIHKNCIYYNCKKVKAVKNSLKSYKTVLSVLDTTKCTPSGKPTSQELILGLSFVSSHM
jgi:hypothetical protein